MSGEPAADRLGAEAGIVLPDRDITLRDTQTGEPMDVTVREYRFREGLRAQALAGGLIADIAALSADPDRFSPSAVNAVLGKHAEAWIDLCALATDLGRDVIGALREPDALTLSLAVWEVNCGFFYQPHPRRDARPGCAENHVGLAGILDSLTDAGHGDTDRIMSALTWRQMLIYYRAAERRRARQAAGQAAAALTGGGRA